jgi:hypothetical protein
MVEPPRLNPLSGPELAAPRPTGEPAPAPRARRPGLRRQFADAGTRLRRAALADLSRIPTPRNLRAAGDGAVSVGLERFASQNPLWRLFLSRLPFKGNARKAIQVACGSSSCCGCSSCSSCTACCVTPPGWIAMAMVAIILVFSVIFDTRPTFTLPLLCERGDTSACAMLEAGSSLRLTVAPGEIPAGAVEGYQRIEEATGIPWFYLLAWEKVATDFGKEDFTFQNAPPPPGDALEAEAAEVMRKIGAATAIDASGDEGGGSLGGGSTNPDAERIRIEIERERNNLVDALTATLRGGSFGYHLLTTEEYRARGRTEQGELRNPWNRFDGGRILGESLLDIYARIAREEGRFVAPIDEQTISPPTAPVLNRIIEARIAKGEAIAEGDAMVEKVIQWTHAPFFPNEPHFSPCEGLLAICPLPPGANWTPTWPNDVPEIPRRCPPDSPNNLRCVYERTLYQGGGRPISADERFYICRRLADARADGRLSANGYRRGPVLPDEALRDELAEQCKVFLTADQMITARTSPSAPGSPAGELGTSFAEEIAPFYTSRLRNPEIMIGEEVRDWKRLKIMMGALVADPKAWGAETGSFFSVDRSVPLKDGQEISANEAPDEVRRSEWLVSAYAEAINSYAESIYKSWVDAQTIRNGLATPAQRAQQADASFENGAVAVAAKANGIEPIYLAATLAADGLFGSEIRRSIETAIDAGGCRPYTSAGSSDGLLGTNQSVVLARAVGVLDQPGAGIPQEYRDLILSQATNEGLDPLLLAAVLKAASNWDPAFKAGDPLGHAGLAGLLLADENAYLAAFDPPDRTDTTQAIAGGARKLYKLVGGKGLKLGLAAYWAGAEATGLAGGSFARFPQASRTFADNALAEYRRLSGLGGEEGSTAGDARIGTSGIGGCWRFGTGNAVAYNPSGGAQTVAMNHCIASRAGVCGTAVLSVAGRQVTVTVVDYLDGDQGSADEAWVAIGPAVSSALGLSGSGPWQMTVRLIDPAGDTETPDPAKLGKTDCRARSVSDWPRSALLADADAAIDWVARCLVAADARLSDVPTRLTDPTVPAVVEETPLRRWGQLDLPWEERSACVSDGKPRSEVDPVYPVVTFTAPGWCDYLEIILGEARRRALESGALGDGVLYGNAPVSPLGYSWPVADPYVTSGWLPRASFPGSMRIRYKGTIVAPHSGVDMRSEQGTGVDLAGRGIYATGDGWMSWTWGKELGTCAAQGGEAVRAKAAWILIYHDEGIVSRYVHLELDPNGDPLFPTGIAARFNSTDSAIAQALDIPNTGGQHAKAIRVRRGELIGWYWQRLCHLHYEAYAGKVGSSGWVRQFGSDPRATYYGNYYAAQTTPTIGTGFPRMNYFDPLELLPQSGGNLGLAKSAYASYWPGGYPPPFNLAAEADRLFPAP